MLARTIRGFAIPAEVFEFDTTVFSVRRDEQCCDCDQASLEISPSDQTKTPTTLFLLRFPGQGNLLLTVFRPLEMRATGGVCSYKSFRTCRALLEGNDRMESGFRLTVTVKEQRVIRAPADWKVVEP